jgi:hypothetical protein
VNGQWTLPDEVVLAVAQQSMRDGTFRSVFIEGDVRSPDEFLMMAQNPRNTVVFAFRGLDPIGVGWLNCINGNRAFCHFLFLSGAWSKYTVEAGRMMIDYWMSFPSDDGGPLIDVMLGAIPATNERAQNFSLRLGGHYLGRIPRMITNAYTGERVDADILYYLRN